MGPQAIAHRELARKAEVNMQTVRYYERKRLLRAPARTSGAYRSYLASDLDGERGATDRQELRGLRDLLAVRRALLRPGLRLYDNWAYSLVIRWRS